MMPIVFKNSVLAGNPLGLGFHADIPLTCCTLRRIPYGLGCPRLCARHYKKTQEVLCSCSNRGRAVLAAWRHLYDIKQLAFKHSCVTLFWLNVI